MPADTHSCPVTADPYMPPRTLAAYLETLAGRALGVGTRATITNALRTAARDHGTALEDVPEDAWPAWVRLVQARHAPTSAQVRIRTVRAYLRWAQVPVPDCMEAPRATRAVGIAWRAALAEWANYMRAAGMRARTIELRTRHLEQLGAFTTRTDPFEVTRGDLLAWLGHNDHWSTETRYSHRSSLQIFYRWAANEGRVEIDPAAKLPRVRRLPAEARPLPMTHLAAAAEDADPRLMLMLMLAAGHGLRRCEIAVVHARDVIDPTDSAYAPDGAGLVLLVHGKGGKTRRVPLSAPLGQLIRDRGDYLFPGRIEGHLSAERVGRLLSRALPEGFTGHTARHLFATTAYHLNHDLFTVQELLGHASADTTRTYVQTGEAAKQATVHDVIDMLPARLRARYTG
jgi:integrase